MEELSKLIDHKLLSVLVVDDNKFTADLVRKILNAHGISEVYQEYSGETALACLFSNHVNVVICDVVMKGMSGLQFTKAVRDGYVPLPGKRETPIVMLTAHSEQNIVMASLKIGANGYLVKPIVPKKLMQLISKSCRSTLPTLTVRGG